MFRENLFSFRNLPEKIEKNVKTLLAKQNTINRMLNFIVAYTWKLTTKYLAVKAFPVGEDM